jgi:chemotaxis protein CheD
VAACLRDPVAGVGGINHFMLPEGGGGVAGESARYGGYAMEMLTNELLKRGAARERLEAKVFGGGNVLRGFTAGTVGERNVQFIREYLARERIPIVAEDLLDVHPRKIVYFPRSGRALVKRLPAAVDAEVQALERLYHRKLQEAPVAAGDVELFA